MNYSVKFSGKETELDELRKTGLAKYGGNCWSNSIMGWQIFKFDNASDKAKFIEIAKSKNLSIDLI